MARSRAATLEVLIRANTAHLTRGFNDAKRRTESLKRSVAALGATIVGVVASRQVVRGLSDLVQSWARQEEAVQSLRAALTAAGHEGSDALGRLSRTAAELQRITTKGDESILEATATLAQLATQLRPAELEQAQRAIVGIADTFLKGDLNNAALLVGKSVGSTTNALSRYGIQVDTAASQGEKLNAIVQQSARFFAVSQERAKTLNGRLQQLKNSWGDLKEQLGRVLADEGHLGEFFTRIKNVVDDVITLLGSNRIQDAFMAAGEIVGTSLALGIMRGLQKIEEFALGTYLTRLFGTAPGRYADQLEQRLQASLRALQFEAGQQRNLQNAPGTALPLFNPLNPGLMTWLQPQGGQPSDGGRGGVPAWVRGLTAPRVPENPYASQKIPQVPAGAALGFGPGGAPASPFGDYSEKLRRAAEETERLTELKRREAFETANLVSSLAGAAASLVNIIRGTSGGGFFGALGAIAGIAGGVVGTLATGGLASPVLAAALTGGGALLAAAAAPGRNEPIPVKVDSYGARAMNQRRQTGPSNVTYFLLDQYGRKVALTEADLLDRQNRDAIPRVVGAIG